MLQARALKIIEDYRKAKEFLKAAEEKTNRARFAIILDSLRILISKARDFAWDISSLNENTYNNYFIGNRKIC
jgi:hypothetical protein